MNKRGKKILKYSINVLFLFICVWFLYVKIDLKKVITYTANVNYSIFILTVIIALVRAWLLGIRWEVLHPANSSKLTKWNYFRFTMLSLLFNKFMPGALGGDIIKTIYAVKEQNSQKFENVISVLVDRAVGLISILIFGLISILITPQKLDINITHLILILLFMAVFFVTISHPKIVSLLLRLSVKIKFKRNLLHRIVTSWAESISYYKINKKKILISLLICIPIHLASFVTFFIFAQAIGIQIDFFELTFVIALMWLITSVPMSIGGMGIREISLVWLLGFFNVTSELAITLSVMAYINTSLVSMIALPLLIDFKKKKELYND